MAVVGIAHMGMLMIDRLMQMLMGMPEAPPGPLRWKLVLPVVVAVMGIAAGRAVVMPVRMPQGCVVVPVGVIVPKQYAHPNHHQQRRERLGDGEGFTQDQHREHHPHERRGGEHHRLARGTQLAESQQIEPDRESIAHGPDR